MVEVAVNTRKQGIDEEQLQLKKLLTARRALDRQQRLQETPQQQTLQQQRQEQEFNAKPSFDGANDTPKKQEAKEMEIYYPQLPQMLNTQAQQLTIQNLPGVENPRAEHPVRQADLRALKEQLEQRKALREHGVEMTIIYADRRVHEARQNPGEDLNKDKLNEQLTKQERDFEKNMKKLTAEQMAELYLRLTGRKVDDTKHLVMPREEVKDIQMTEKGKRKRGEKLVKRLSHEKQKEFKEIVLETYQKAG